MKRLIVAVMAALVVVALAGCVHSASPSPVNVDGAVVSSSDAPVDTSGAIGEMGSPSSAADDTPV